MNNRMNRIERKEGDFYIFTDRYISSGYKKLFDTYGRDFDILEVVECKVSRRSYVRVDGELDVNLKYSISEIFTKNEIREIRLKKLLDNKL